MRLPGQVALVTGASRGIGRGIALACAREGADVAVNGRDPAAVAEVVALVRAQGRRAMGVVQDVAEVAGVRSMVDHVAAELGRLDLLVNNAGLYQVRPILEIEEADWDRILATNLRGAFFCAQAAARLMVRQGFGTIVNVASDATWSGGMNPCAHYCASKAGMASFTRSFAKELAPQGIRVNAVAPGMIATDMGEDAAKVMANLKIPLGRLGTPDDVADVVLFLASDSARYMTGTILNVTAGLVLDR
jgi:NAD(P)-dependent dehydrogenase (short-subunit alcohol dehydrogenase family)